MADFGSYMLSEGFDYTVPPILKDIDFWFWKARMTSFIKSFDYDMWNVFTNTFDFKPRKDWTEKEKKMFSLNIRAMKILYSTLTENDFEKIRFCFTAKDIWDTLDSLYTSNKCVEVESVDSSCETTSYISTIHEQVEVDNEEGEIIEHFHDLVNIEEQEENDSRKELVMDGQENSLSGAQHELKVKSSNSSCDFRKTDFQSLHKIVFQPIIDSIEKSKKIFNHAGNSCGKKRLRQTDHSKSSFLDQHNTCIKSHNAYHHITCNYCGKSGHISHTCYIRRNSNLRNKYVWVPKRQVMSNPNNQGPKYMWVPKCSSSTLCMQIEYKKNGHKGTEMMKKKPRVSHAPRKRFIPSISKRRTLGAPIAGTAKFNHKEMQWRKRVRSTSRMDYHRVPLNYLEENKKRRISQASSKRLLESMYFERRLPTPKARYSKYQHPRKMQWVSKSNPPSI